MVRICCQIVNILMILSLLASCTNTELIFELKNLPGDEQQLIIEVKPKGHPTTTRALRRRPGSSRNTLTIRGEDLGGSLDEGTAFSLTVHVMDRDGCSSQCGRYTGTWQHSAGWITARPLILQGITHADCAMQLGGDDPVGQPSLKDFNDFNFVAASPTDTGAWIIAQRTKPEENPSGSLFYFDGNYLSNIALPRGFEYPENVRALGHLDDGNPILVAISEPANRTWIVGKNGEIFYLKNDSVRWCKHEAPVTKDNSPMLPVLGVSVAQTQDQDRVLLVGGNKNDPAVWYCGAECAGPGAFARRSLQSFGSAPLQVGWLGNSAWVGSEGNLFAFNPGIPNPPSEAPDITFRFPEISAAEYPVSMLSEYGRSEEDRPNLFVSNFKPFTVDSMNKIQPSKAMFNAGPADGTFTAAWSLGEFGWILKQRHSVFLYNIKTGETVRAFNVKSDEILRGGVSISVKGRNCGSISVLFGNRGTMFGSRCDASGAVTDWEPFFK